MEKKYLKYNVDDWLNDELFLAYIQGSDDSILPVLDQLKTDQKQSEIISDAERIAKNLSSVQEKLEAKRLDEIFQNINSHIDHTNQKSNLPVRKLWVQRSSWIGAVAAAIALVLIFMPFSNSNNQFFATQIGEEKEIKLPDASVVQLNTLSSIKYDEKSWEENRELQLQGEAFFKVSKGSAFTVVSDQGKVTVLGTQFNILDREGKYEVMCTEGRVQVTFDNGEKYILEAGDRVMKKEEEAIEFEEDKVSEIAWLNEYVELENTTLNYVFSELERYFEIKIQNKKKYGDLEYTGFFNTNNLDSAIYQILWPLDISYQLLDQKRLILE